jgi:O-antigen ligase/polysaccharide polymerase Wzy-like membrane protein
MLSLTTAPERPRSSAAARAPRRATPDVLLGAMIAAGLGTIAFVTTGGTALGPNTWAEIALIVVGAGLLVAAALVSAPGRAWGVTALVLFAALTAWTAASVAWSVQPAESWIEAGRTASYLAAFACGLALARLAPARWRAMLGAVAALTAVVSLYALVVKVFPATFDPNGTVGRLRLPLDYFNAVGQLAALGVPAWVWIGARREGGAFARALAVPALGVLSMTIVLSYSRGAIVIVVLGLAIWFALVPLRLRAALTLALGLLGGALATAWALHERAVSHDNFSLAARTSAGHKFGLVLAAMIVIQTAVGLVVARRLDGVKLAEGTRRRIGGVLIMLVVLLGIAGIGAVAASSRGLTGTVSHVWNQLTSPNSGGEGNNPSRLLGTGSSRGRYWNEGLKVGEHALLKGVGAGGFATAHLRYYTSSGSLAVEHAHSYLIDTFADLGLVGLALSLALFVAWAIATMRSADVRRRGPPSAEWIGLTTLLCTVIMFGLGAAIDWTWFIPGITVPALVSAGWLAGRGPIDGPDGVESRARVGAPGAILAITLATAAVLVTGWTIFQPLRSANADAAALTAATNGDAATAIAKARTAADEDGVSVDPLFELAAFYQAGGETAAALGALDEAIVRQPNNPATWYQKGELLARLGRLRAALVPLRRAAALDLDDQVGLKIVLYQLAHPRHRIR